MIPRLLDRRTFLRCGAGGVALVVAGPLCPACGDGGGPPDTPPGDPLASAVILSDPALCAGCGRCALTCSSLHDASPLVTPDAPWRTAGAASPSGLAATCRMCPRVSEDGALVTPACVAVCPTGAARITAADDPVYGSARLRVIDSDRCDGCGACVDACPYSHPLLDGGLARKCDLCIDRAQVPPCVAACPSSALRHLSPWTDRVPRPFPWEAGA